HQALPRRPRGPGMVRRTHGWPRCLPEITRVVTPCPPTRQVLYAIGVGTTELRISASGKTDYAGGAGYPPDGTSPNPFARGNENYVGSISAPVSSLIGVFLNDPPVLNANPPRLEFTPELQLYTQIAPVLQQPFFIGDGLGENNVQQIVLVPQGAT